MEERRETDVAIEKKLDELIEEFRAHKALIESGFTRDDQNNVDVVGHRNYHSDIIHRAALMESRRNSIIDKAISGGLMSILAFVAYSAWHHVLDIIEGTAK